MNVLTAASKGLRTVLGSPRVLIGLWLFGVIFAVPFAMVVKSDIGESIHGTMAEESLRQGFDTGWYGEYEYDAQGLGKSFRPTVIGATAFYDNLEDWLGGTLFKEYPEVVFAGLAYGLLWIFLMGGVLDGYARPAESAVRARFVQAGGIYFFRFVRLALISGVLYFGIYRLHRLFFDLLAGWTRDETRELRVLWWSLLFYALTALLLTLVHMIFAYAKIATVVDNRKGMLAAVLRAVRFVFSFPLKTFALYYGVAFVSLLALAFYSLIAPGPSQTNLFTIGFAFAVGQAFLLTKLLLRLTLLGAQTHLYKSLATR